MKHDTRLTPRVGDGTRADSRYPSKDANDLLVWCEWDTTARMKKFAKSADLRKAMKGAGVISKPEVSFHGTMEDLSTK